MEHDADSTAACLPALNFPTSAQCQVGCWQCKPDGSCHTCNNGYKNKGGSCELCANYSDCVPCLMGYEPFGGCHKCAPDGSNCLECWDQYKGVPKKCIKVGGAGAAWPPQPRQLLVPLAAIAVGAGWRVCRWLTEPS